jgi:DNA-binding transcriptional LysR family regulator
MKLSFQEAGIGGRQQPLLTCLRLKCRQFQSNNGLALRMAALEGFGIVMQSSVMLGGDVAAGRLVELLQDHLPPPQPMHIVYPKDRQLVPKLTRLVEFLVAQLAA